MRLQQLREVATNHRVLLCKIINKFVREWHGKPSMLTWQQCKACTRRPGAVGPPRQSSHGKAVRDHFLGSSRRSFRTKSPTVYNPLDNLSRIKESCFITKTRIHQSSRACLLELRRGTAAHAEHPRYVLNTYCRILVWRRSMRNSP